ncbi:unnamed protein product [Meganyctiphanes norvegica]|uniref:BZIP domain-containing protein n=1 Tax=Meganyctiphanes norvegica TaxID=48144 RepID=A0AAV2Q817_MEGNR
MDNNRNHNILFPADTYDSLSFEQEIADDGYNNNDLSESLYNISIAHNTDGNIAIQQHPSNPLAFNQILFHSEYPHLHNHNIEENYNNNPYLESADMPKNSKFTENVEKKGRRKTCTFFDYTTKKQESSSQRSKPSNLSGSTRDSSLTPVLSEEQLLHNDEWLFSNQSYSGISSSSLECIASNTRSRAPLRTKMVVSPTTYPMPEDSFDTYLSSTSNFNTEDLITSDASLITLPVIGGKFMAEKDIFVSPSIVPTDFTAEDGVLLSSSTVPTDLTAEYEVSFSSSTIPTQITAEDGVFPSSSKLQTDFTGGDGVFPSTSTFQTCHQYSEDSDLFRGFESEDLYHVLQLSETYDDYSIGGESPPVIKLEPDNTTIISLDPESSIGIEGQAGSSRDLNPSIDQSIVSQAEQSSDTDDMSIGPIPPGRKRRPRVRYNTLSEEQKHQRIRLMNNDACVRYRKNKKQTVKEIEKDIHDLELKNKKLQELYDSIKAQKEQAEQLMPHFIQDSGQSKSKGKSSKRRSSKT